MYPAWAINLRARASVQVKQIPLVAFDVGGIYEMLDFSSNTEAIVLDTTVDGLTAKLTGQQSPSPQVTSAGYRRKTNRKSLSELDTFSSSLSVHRHAL